jgi:transposase-like protein
LTPQGRRRMVALVLDAGWTIEATADRFQVDAKTVRKWRDRFVTEGDDGLFDRSSRPKRSPNRTAARLRRRVLHLRQTRRWGADRIAHHVKLAPSMVQPILNAAGCGRLDRGDRAGREPVVRYQRERPGELIHVDVKKIAAIPPGGGWKLHGRGNTANSSYTQAGYRYIHSALDDRSRLVYSEILNDEQAVTAAALWHRAVDWFAGHGICCERVITDNGTCYKRQWQAARDATGTTVKDPNPFA